VDATNNLKKTVVIEVREELISLLWRSFISQ
jgi:hypothetical protein